MSTRRLTRRDMLRLAGLTAGSAVIAACGATPAPAAVSTGAPTAAPPQPTAAEQATVAPADAGQATQAPAAGGAVAATYADGQAAYGTYERANTGKVDLLLWGPPGDETDPWIRAVKGAMQRFSEDYPEIKATWEPVAWNDLDTKVNAALAAKQGPDVLFEADREGEFPRRGAIREIPEEVLSRDYIEQHKFYEVRPLDDGKLYWVHCAIMGPIIYANRQLLTDAGVTPEDVPTTWDEFGRFCQQLTKSDDGQMAQAGFAFNGYARYIWNDMMYQQGAHVYDQKKAYVDGQESINAWQMLVDFYDTYGVNDRAFLNYDEAFGSGKAAFAQVWTWFGSTLEANYPDIDWVPVTYPTFDGNGPYGRFDYDGPLWMVTTLATDEKMMAGWELFKYHAHEYQFLVERSHTSGMVLVTEPHPDYAQLFTEAAAKDEPSQEDRRLQSLAVLSRQYDGGMVFPGEVAAPFDDIWHRMEDAILLNQEPVTDVVKEYQTLYDEMLGSTNFWITPEA